MAKTDPSAKCYENIWSSSGTHLGCAPKPKKCQCFIFNCPFLYFQLLLFCSAAAANNALLIPSVKPDTNKLPAPRKRNLLISAYSTRFPKCRLLWRHLEVPGFRTEMAWAIQRWSISCQALNQTRDYESHI